MLQSNFADVCRLQSDHVVTYIGNAPNFMVYAIARRAGVKMPGFFLYMIWPGAILFPVFAALTFLFRM